MSSICVSTALYRRSFHRGIGAWKDYYGERLLVELRSQAAVGRWPEARKTAVLLLNLCGMRLPIIVVLHSLSPRLRMKIGRSLNALRKPSGDPKARPQS